MAGRSRGIQPQLYAALLNAIRSGTLKTGDRLLEAEIMRMFGVGRSPARNVLLQMERDRLLTANSGRGYLLAQQPMPRSGAAPFEGGGISLWSSSESVYEELEQVLADTVLFSSVRLVEERLAAHFSVSRTVIRDVLTRLHVVGLVQKDSSGRWVAERITLEHIAELYELRRLLEPTALKLAMAHIDSRFVEQMERDVLDVIEERVLRTAEILHQLEQHLHVDVLSHCSNRALWRALQRTQLILVSNRSMFAINIAASAKAVTGSVVEHRDIIRLIRSGDADAAAAALAKHLMVSQSIWLDRFSEITSAATLSHPHYLLDL